MDSIETACEKALSFTASPSYKSIKNILVTGIKKNPELRQEPSTQNKYGITRGARYYGGKEK